MKPLSPQQTLVLNCLKSAARALSSGEISKQVGLTQQNINNSLSWLVDKKIVATELRGARNKFYSVAQEGIEQRDAEPININGVQGRIVRISHLRMQPKDEPLRKHVQGQCKSSLG